MASARLFASRCSSLLAATKSSTAVAASGADAVTAATAAAVKPKARNSHLFVKSNAISPAFQQFLGVSEVSRADAVKQIWDYIKIKNLQNPENKREICCDEKLKSIFDGNEKVHFLQIASFVSKHFPKPEPKPKTKTTISPAFQEFLGVSEVSRNDALKQVWDYIKSENLQSSENKKEILCDEKLKTIFDGKEKVVFTEIAYLISKHFQVAE